MSRFSIEALATRFIRSGVAEDASRPSSPDISALIATVRDSAVSLQHDYNGAAAALSHQIGSIAEKMAALHPAVATIHTAYGAELKRGDDLERDNAQHSSRLQVAMEELSKERQALAECERQIELVSRERNDLGERVDSLRADLAKTCDTLAATEVEAGGQRARLIALEDARDGLASRLSKRETELVEAESRLLKVTDQLGEARVSAELKSRALETLSANFAESQAAGAKADTLVVHANAEAEGLRRRIHRLEREGEAARGRRESEIERLKAECQTLRLANAELQSSRSTLEEALSQQREKAAGASSHMGYLHNTLRRLLSERDADAGGLERALDDFGLLGAQPLAEPDLSPAEDLERETPAAAGVARADERPPVVRLVGSGRGSAKGAS
jgi:chromosome segregation ATPase